MLMQAGLQAKPKSVMWPVALVLLAYQPASTEVQLSTTQEAVNCMLACISSERCHCGMERCNPQCKKTECAQNRSRYSCLETVRLMMTEVLKLQRSGCHPQLSQPYFPD